MENIDNLKHWNEVGGEHQQAPPAESNPVSDTETITFKTNHVCFYLHLAQLLSYAIPLTGLFTVYHIWNAYKTAYPAINKHGRIILNWQFTQLIFYIPALPIPFILYINMITYNEPPPLIVFWIFAIPFCLVLLLCYAGIVFMIIGAVKANKGKSWKYPLSIPFFHVP